MNASEILIDIAQDRYPIGTVAKSALTGTEFTSSGSFILNEDNSIYSVAKQGAFSVYDARMKKWAEVVEQYKKGDPAFCMVSHDGVNIDLYDKCFCVDKHDMNPVETTMKVGIREAVEIGENVVFSTREAAEKWIFEQKPKSILSGKVAIQVNNDREFKLLMEHYESKGWKWCSGDSPLDFNPGKKKTIVGYMNYFTCFNYKPCKNNDFTIIPFSDFAAEVGIKVPVFVMTSEDGVQLYSGMEMFGAKFSQALKTWSLNGFHLEGMPFILSDKNVNPPEGERFPYIEEPDHYKAFSSKKAAEAWILEANKPKEIKFQLFDGKTAILTKEGVQVTEISSTTKSIWLTPSDIEDLSHNYSVLQQQSDKNASE